MNINAFHKILKVAFSKKVDTFKCIYYNCFCKNIIRHDNAIIIPYVGAILDLHKTSRIMIKNDLLIAYNKLKHSKAEAYIRMGKGAVWNCNNGGYICYGVTIEIKENAVLDSGFFLVNSRSTIVCEKHISIGNDVGIGRNNIIFDSDFHPVFNDNGTVRVNPPQDVVIDDHVWITSNVTVLKGVHIAEGTLIGSTTVITHDTEPGSFVTGQSNGKKKKDKIVWRL